MAGFWWMRTGGGGGPFGAEALIPVRPAMPVARRRTRSGYRTPRPELSANHQVSVVFDSRSGAEYTLNRSPFRKPTRVWLNSLASATARLDGAPTAARTGMP